MKMIWCFVGISVLRLVSVARGYSNKYCKMGMDHTMCYTDPIGRNCTARNQLQISITDDDRDDILDEHNLIRQKMAAGGQKGYPGARRMYEMFWNDELASIAQRWADQCNFFHDSRRDIVDDDGEEIQIGQNIGLHNAYSGTNMNYRFAVSRWYDRELVNFPVSSVDHYEFDEKNGHLSQVVWGDTYEVGCGISRYAYPDSTVEAEGPVFLFVCNYSPTGNWDNKPVYIKATNKDQIGDMCDPDYESSYFPLCG